MQMNDTLQHFLSDHTILIFLSIFIFFNFVFRIVFSFFLWFILEASVVDLHQSLDSFLQSVVRSRRDKALLGWKAWILEDPPTHPYRWLRPDLVPPSPFLQYDPGDTVGGSGVIADLALIDAKFREAWMPYFSRSSRGSADLDDFSREVAGGWLLVVGRFSSSSSYW